MSESKAHDLLTEWKKDSYAFGYDVLGKVGGYAGSLGKSSILVCSTSEWAKEPTKTIMDALEAEGVRCTRVLGARPNCPQEDLYRVALSVKMGEPDFIVAFGGGSTIDCAKAASVLATYDASDVGRALGADWFDACSINPYFGTGNVSSVKKSTGREPIPVIAVQTYSGSAAHLTKYSNITDPAAGQKKLIVDDAIIPRYAVFDYGITCNSPRSLTLDGGLDGISHIWEVFMGATGAVYYEKIEEIAKTGIGLIVGNLQTAIRDKGNVEARTAIGLGTDLGGYAIMIGGTNGPHLGSFSLIDYLSHGRACAILLPYYTVFFSDMIQGQLRTISPIFKEAGFVDEKIDGLSGRDLGEEVAKGMIEYNRSLGFPTTLSEAGVDEAVMGKMLEAAKNPQLKMKLLNMPVPLDPKEGDIEKYMKGVLEAAFTGKLSSIKSKRS